MLRRSIHTRRKFLGTTTAASLGLLAGPGRNYAAPAPAPADGRPWSFSLLGDIHFDKLDHHDMAWVHREQPNDVRQIENYSRISADNLPALLEHLKSTISATPDCDRLIQIGDLVEGLCGSPPLARRQCEEAIALLRRQDFGVPFLVTKGNHDITGPGAGTAYDEIVLPFIEEGLATAAAAAETGTRSPLAARFAHDRGDWLFVFYDAYDPASLEWFEHLMTERRPKRLFFVIHPPVVPYNARASWCVYSGDTPRDRDRRQRLLNVLGRHRAIVLSGHLHKYALVERATPEGSFTQLAVSSVAYALDGAPKDLLSGLASYGPGLVDLEPAHSPGTVAARRDILENERPFIRRFDYGNFWGHAMIRIDGGRVEADIFQGLTNTPWKTVTLSG